MKRREFIKVIVGSAVWPLAADAQPSNKPVIGFLSARSAKESAHLVDAFRKGLAEHGLVEGQNVTIEYRWADSHYERLAGQASDLLTRQPAVLISVGGDMTAKAASTATKSTPIVAVFIGDPVVGGYVASLGRPGGNITGVSNLNAVIEAKRIGLLRDVKPGITTVGVLLNPDSVTAATQRKDIEEAARTIGLRAEFLEAKNDPELEAAFKSIVANRIPALCTFPLEGECLDKETSSPSTKYPSGSRMRMARVPTEVGRNLTEAPDGVTISVPRFFAASTTRFKSRTRKIR